MSKRVGKMRHRYVGKNLTRIQATTKFRHKTSYLVSQMRSWKYTRKTGYVAYIR